MSCMGQRDDKLFNTEKGHMLKMGSINIFKLDNFERMINKVLTLVVFYTLSYHGTLVSINFVLANASMLWRVLIIH